MGFDCDVPEKVLDALVSNHWGARSDVCPALPEPNMIMQRRSNSHSHVSYFLAKPVHRGPTAREAPLRLFARISEFYRQALGADPGYNGVLTHNPMRSAHRHGEFLTHWGCQIGPQRSRARSGDANLDGEDRWVWQRLRVWGNDCFGEVSELRPWAETTRRSPGAVSPALPMKFGPAQRTLDGAACRRIYLVRAR